MCRRLPLPLSRLLAQTISCPISKRLLPPAYSLLALTALADAATVALCALTALPPMLAELAYSPAAVPSAAARVAYFPEIDSTYLHMHPPVQTHDGVETNLGYLRRMLLLAAALPQKFAGGTVACFSHAASIALVAALTHSESLDVVGTFSPCGIWKLVTTDGGSTWKVERRGDDNSGHVSENAKSTFSWGFRHSTSSAPEQWEDMWREAVRLGPTGR